MPVRTCPRKKPTNCALRHLPGLPPPSGGRFAFGPLTIEAAGVDRMVLGEFHISDLSSDRLGEFAIEGFDGAVQGQGAVKIGRFAFGGIVFPSLDTVLAAMRAEAEQMPFDETRRSRRSASSISPASMPRRRMSRRPRSGNSASI